MKEKLLLGICLLVGAAVAASAQGLTKAWNEETPLTSQDRAIIFSILDSQVHGKAPGTVANWANPAPGGHSGTVTLLAKSSRQGMPCEQIEYRIMEPQSTQAHGRYVLTSCQVADGTWKFAE